VSKSSHQICRDRARSLDTLERSESGKAAISAHMEKLPDGDAREAMRERWRGALERVVAAV
jgi:hypothetical protein